MNQKLRILFKNFTEGPCLMRLLGMGKSHNSQILHQANVYLMWILASFFSFMPIFGSKIAVMKVLKNCNNEIHTNEIRIKQGSSVWVIQDLVCTFLGYDTNALSFYWSKIDFIKINISWSDSKDLDLTKNDYSQLNFTFWKWWKEPLTDIQKVLVQPNKSST